MWKRVGCMSNAASGIYESVTFKNVFLHKEILSNIYNSCYEIRNFPFAKRLDLFSVIEPYKKVLFFDVGKKELCGTRALDYVFESKELKWADAEVVLSHFHDDHDGCLDYCIEQGVEKAFHGPRIPYSNRRKEHFLLQSGIRKQGDKSLDSYVDFFLQKDRFSNATEDHLFELKENTTFCLAGYEFHVVYTPGHTPEHISLYEPHQKILFAGDFILDAAPGVMQFESQTHLLYKYLSKLLLARKVNLKVLLMSHHEALFNTSDINTMIEKQILSYVHPLVKTLDVFSFGESLDAYEAAQRYAGSAEEFGMLDPGFRIRKVAMMCSYLDYLCLNGYVSMDVTNDGREVFSLCDRNFDESILLK